MAEGSEYDIGMPGSSRLAQIVEKRGHAYEPPGVKTSCSKISRKEKEKKRELMPWFKPTIPPLLLPLYCSVDDGDAGSVPPR